MRTLCLVIILLANVGCATYGGPTKWDKTATYLYEVSNNLANNFGHNNGGSYLVLIDGTQIGPFNNLYGCMQYRAAAMRGVGWCR